MVLRGFNNVPRAVPIAEVLLPDPRKLSTNTFGIFSLTVRPAAYQPLSAFMAVNNHPLPQTQVWIRVRGITKEGIEVDLHAKQVVAFTGWAGGADLPSKLLEILEAEHQPILA